MSASNDLITRREALRRSALLLGGAITAPTLAGVLAGCSRLSAEGGWVPQVLSPEQDELVLLIADHIIPDTDTPGAGAARVNEFIDVMLAEYYPARERDHFLAGLAGVDERARQAHGTAFRECTPEQQLALVSALDRETFAAHPPQPDPEPPAEPPEVHIRTGTGASSSESHSLPEPQQRDTVKWIPNVPTERIPEQRSPAPFFRTLKELTVIGYYTSGIGATQELRYEPVPGRYEGCISLSDVGRIWAV